METFKKEDSFRVMQKAAKTCYNFIIDIVINKKILVIDLDPQGNATTGFGIANDTNEKTIYDVLNGNCNFEDSIKESFEYGATRKPKISKN